MQRKEDHQHTIAGKADRNLGQMEVQGMKHGLYNPSHEHDACGIAVLADLKKGPSHRLVTEALQALVNLEHRGATGGDGKSGDGAGILCQIPDNFFRRVMGLEDLNNVSASSNSFRDGLPYGLGMFFLPRAPLEVLRAKKIVESAAASRHFQVLAWRDVPVLPQVLGDKAMRTMPRICQAVFRPEPADTLSDSAADIQQESTGFKEHIETGLELRLFLLRKYIEKAAREAGFSPEEFYIPSLSCKTIVYKGMFVASQFASFYPDLNEPDFAARFAIVHQRYSTNTFPSWPLAQPFRMAAHNGEINTLRKNMNSMRARQATMASERFGPAFFSDIPVFDEGGSDSAIFDNIFELLVRAGRDPEQVFMMMIQEPVNSNYHHSHDKKAFYDYYAALLETWDGPAAMCFTDGTVIGAGTDRNGLRPFRYLLTSEGFFFGASEAGCLNLPGEENSTIEKKGILKPGEMILLDCEQGQLIGDTSIKSRICRRKPYRHWLEQNQLELRGLFSAPDIPDASVAPEKLAFSAAYFDYNRESLAILAPMLTAKQEAVSAMGTKKPPAILSAGPIHLFAYFRQLFAQVTNPPIDPYRETLVMSLENYIGKQRNLLEETPEHSRQLRLVRPILSNEDIKKLRTANFEDFKVAAVSLCFTATAANTDSADFETTLNKALQNICREAERKIDAGANLILLSDRDISETNAAIPSLLGVSAVHTHLVDAKKRHLAGLIIETGEAREIHDIAVLLAYGASGVNPWMVFDLLPMFASLPEFSAVSAETMADNYIEAVNKGILKIMSKLGISTVSSYRGSRLFEATGLSANLVQRYFRGTESRIGGIGLSEIAIDLMQSHRNAVSVSHTMPCTEILTRSPAGRDVPWPSSLAAHLTKAVRTEDASAWRAYADGMDSPERQPFALRDLFSFKPAHPVPRASVEPAESIMRRFSVAAMSIGAISPEAHEALSRGANSAGSWSNSGEGGEDFKRNDAALTASRQIASGRFGVTARYAATCRELQIKIAQGAKPGEGGQLPGAKVTAYIAELRHAIPGKTLISPPPHHDIYSIEDLSQLIYDLRCVNPSARIAVKLGAQAGIGTVAAGVAKAGADCVVVSSGDGGTGAAPLSSLDHAGNYWETALPEIRQVLAMNGFDLSVVVQVDGRLRTARDIVIAAILGAREFAFGTAALIAMGCIACGKCNLGKCPVGIATQDPALRTRFKGSPEHLGRFFRFIAEDVRSLLAELGVRTLDELAGRYELLDFHGCAGTPYARLTDFSAIVGSLEIARRYPLVDEAEMEGFGPPALPLPEAGLRNFKPEKRKEAPVSDVELSFLNRALEACKQGKAFAIQAAIRNSDRSVGAALSGELVRQGLSLPPDSIQISFAGSAGQSFGAFLASGITFIVEGEVNDYLGKSLSGGTIIVRPDRNAKFEPEEQIIAGNVCLYGATAGSVFINGKAGERFCVRNSGALAVVEGTGNHACEYMTDGVAVVLGKTGVNFGAGMTGGIAYVYDEDQLFDTRCNLANVDLSVISNREDQERLHAILERHHALTGSPKAARLLASWEQMLPLFLKVTPAKMEQ